MFFYNGRLDGTDAITIVVHQGTCLLVLQRLGDVFKTLAIHSGKLGGAAEWEIKANDRIVIGDVDGDGNDEIIIADPDNLAVVRLTAIGLEVAHKSVDWVKSSDGSFGWNLGTNDRHFVADLNGDGRAEIVMRSDEWLGVLRYDVGAKRFVALHLSFDWVKSADNSFGWNLGRADQHFIGDVNGDNRDEIVIRSSEWLGVISFNGSKYVLEALSYDWVTNAGGDAGWNLGARDRHLVGDVDGDGKDEIILRSDEWMGVVSLAGNKLFLDHISHDWVRLGSGGGGWNIGRDDRWYLADINDDGRDEIIMRSDTYIGLIAFEGGRLVAKHLTHGWVLSSSETAGWNMGKADEHWVVRTKAGADLLCVTNQTSRFVGAFSTNGNRFFLDWIQSSWLRKVPPYEPGKWNNDDNVQRHNNCYNYACDIVLFNNKSQPGRAHGIFLNSDNMNCADVSEAAQADGLRSISGALEVAPDYHKVALVIWPGYDYHWYRLDQGGKWSHKPGSTEATNRDQNGQPISNPETAARGNYTQFCGYYWISHREVVIN